MMCGFGLVIVLVCDVIVCLKMMFLLEIGCLVCVRMKRELVI